MSQWERQDLPALTPSAAADMELSGQGREGEAQRGFIFHF